jgi:peptidoglycan/xylan/chitin deacetylase (PgdA/CDA1 family)
MALAIQMSSGGIVINGHTLTRDETRLQLDMLGRWFDFIRLEDLPRRLFQPSKRRFCLLTFDDGKRNNFTEIAPELESRGVPAVFYVTTDPLSQGTCLWFDLHAQLLKHLGFCPAGLELTNLKKCPLNLVLKRLANACSQHDFVPGRHSQDFQPMTWDEARSLAQRGFTIGAHGLTHAILTNESTERAFKEIEGSMAKIAVELGAPCTTFAFPNGSCTPELTRHALRCGATTVMTTEPTWMDHRVPFWRIPRIQLFGGFSREKIELKVALAALRGALANPNGSGRAYFWSDLRDGILRRKPILQAT